MNIGHKHLQATFSHSECLMVRGILSRSPQSWTRPNPNFTIHPPIAFVRIFIRCVSRCLPLVLVLVSPSISCH